MSQFGALYSGVSGLSAQSQAMGIIADNITNVTTTAFKRTTSEFSSLVTCQRTATAFSPGGVQPAIRQLVDTQGLLQSSNSPFDLGINGDGFFVVSSITNPSTADGTFFYTRDGTFVPDKNGDLKNAAGFFLRGYEVTNKITGAIPSDRASLLTTKTVNVKNLSDAVAASTSVSLQANLQSTQTVNASIGTFASGVATTNMAPSATGVVNFTLDFARSVSIVDSQGGTRTLTFAFLKSATANTWANTWNVEALRKAMQERLAVHLCDIVDETGVAAAVHVRRRGVRAERDHRRVLPPRIPAHGLDELEAVHPRHLDIANDDVEVFAGLAHLERGVGITGGGYLVPRRRQQRPHQIAEERAVIDQQHPPRAVGAAGRVVGREPIGEGLGQVGAGIENLGRLSINDRASHDAVLGGGDFDIQHVLDDVDDLVHQQSHRVVAIGENEDGLPPFGLHFERGIDGDQRHQLAAVLHHVESVGLLHLRHIDLFEPGHQ